MTKKEAQEIVNEIDPETVIDHNWSNYLLDDKDSVKLRALNVVTGKIYDDLLKTYEGEKIFLFQTEKTGFVNSGICKAVMIEGNESCSIIFAEDNVYVYYFDRDGKFNKTEKTKIKESLWSIVRK